MKYDLIYLYYVLALCMIRLAEPTEQREMAVSGIG